MTNSNNNKKIRTRFAPSPTGYIHIGNIRTALFSWLYAKKMSGDFFIRIDDTDDSRNSKIYTTNIIDILNWLTLPSSNDVVFQSNNHNRYHSIIKKLLSENKAYKCYCTKERLNKLKANQISLLFQEFVRDNQKERIFFQNALDYLNSLKNKENIDSSDLNENNFFGNQTSELAEAYNRVKSNIHLILEDLEKLIEHLDKEKEETSKFFKSIHIEEIRSLREFEMLSLNYNEKEHIILTSLESKLPELIKVQTQLFGIKDRIETQDKATFHQAAGKFINHFLNIYQLIKEKKNKETVFVKGIETRKANEE